MNDKEKIFVSAVVYLFNEGSFIKSYLRGLEDFLKLNFEKYEIIVVNDASTDQSAQEVKSYVSSQDDAKITMVTMGYHQGMEISMAAGVDMAIGDFVYELEFTNSDYDWHLLMDVYRHLLKGYDIVSARGNVGDKVTPSRVFYQIMNRYANLQYPLTSGGSFRIVSRRAINRIHSLAIRVPYRKVAYANCGLKCDTLVYEPIKKVKLKRSSVRNRLELATNSMVLFTDVAFRFTLWFAVIMILFSLGIAVYSVCSLLIDKIVETWAIGMLFAGIALSGILISLSFIIRYLSTLVRLNFLKRDNVIESIEKLQ